MVVIMVVEAVFEVVLVSMMVAEEVLIGVEGRFWW